MTEILPVLYLIARTDIDSMNPGKLAAQMAHGANAMAKHAKEFREENWDNPHTRYNQDVVKNIGGFHTWENSTLQGFGTTICLDGGSIQNIQSIVTTFQRLNYVSGMIHDPSYPVRDGKITHLVPLDTGAYIFVPDKYTDDICSLILGKLDLYK